MRRGGDASSSPAQCLSVSRFVGSLSRRKDKSLEKNLFHGLRSIKTKLVDRLQGRFRRENSCGRGWLLLGMKNIIVMQRFKKMQ